MFVTSDHKDSRYIKDMETNYAVKYKGDFVANVYSADDETGELTVSTALFEETENPLFQINTREGEEISLSVAPELVEIVKIDGDLPSLKVIDWEAEKKNI